MIEAAAVSTSPIDAYEPAFQDRVRVDDGREGVVIGFYRRESEAVLVAFAGGDSAEFDVADLGPA